MRSFFSFISTIFRYLWRTLNFSRVVVANLLFILLIGIIAASWLGQEVKVLPSRAALLLKPAGTITETTPLTDPWRKILRQELEELQESPLQDIIDVIETATNDPRIPLLVLDSSRIERISLSQIMTIGKALQQFRARGKKVVATGDHFSQSHYLLASYADEIILNPVGGVELKGFARYRLYGRQALEKLKINFHLFRAGTYKSALEPFIRDNMSEAAREANQSWLDDLWQNASTQILTSRHQLTKEKLNDYINNYDRHLATHKGNAANAALAAGLVDRLLSRPQWRRYLAGLVGYDEDDDEDFKQIDWDDYGQQIKKSYLKTPTHEKIALIIARGDILPGRQPNHRIGADNLSRLLRKARIDSGIKAVVLRLDSGGGSMTASEIIRQDIVQLKESGKPVIISMGNLAASGAYWIAADADEIWAEPTTLTGSIGVFGAWPTFEKSLHAIGIHSDGVGTSPWAGNRNPTKPLLPAQARALQLGVDQGYQRFLEIVAGARRLSMAEIKQVAGGRVWSGRQAKELGLIDHLGDLSDAVTAAAARVGLSATDTIYLKNEKSAADLIGELLSSQQHALISLLPESYRILADNLHVQETGMLHLEDPQSIYAHSLLDDLLQ